MRRPLGLTILAAFFAFGSLMALLASLGLLLPGHVVEPMWRLNPQAYVALTALHSWGVVLMLTVGIACALAAIGLWTRAMWGHHLAVGILALNLVGDVLNAAVRGDLRALIGIPPWGGHDPVPASASYAGAVSVPFGRCLTRA